MPVRNKIIVDCNLFNGGVFNIHLELNSSSVFFCILVSLNIGLCGGLLIEIKIPFQLRTFLDLIKSLELKWYNIFHF